MEEARELIIIDTIRVATVVSAIVPPGALSSTYDKKRPRNISITPNKIEIIRVFKKFFLNCIAEATGITIIDDITRMPITLIDIEIVTPTITVNK